MLVPLYIFVNIVFVLMGRMTYWMLEYKYLSIYHDMEWCNLVTVRMYFYVLFVLIETYRTLYVMLALVVAGISDVTCFIILLR